MCKSLPKNLVIMQINISFDTCLSRNRAIFNAGELRQCPGTVYNF